MKIQNFIEILNADFYTGVPDSQLKGLCDYLMDRYGIDPKHHIIAANEGNCAAIAAGYYMATRKVPVVYMQNSGEGNIINPLTSLLNERIYAIPIIFVIGWRGEPGEITRSLLEHVGVSTFIIGKETPDIEVADAMKEFRKLLAMGKDVAFIIRKNALSDAPHVEYENDNFMVREEIIRHIVKVSGEDPIISTTGKASRELFEIRETNGQAHKYDFLTIGSMGHSSSIALGIAVNKPEQKIWCIDGDGAVLMHMGAMAVIGAHKPSNLIHIVINNGAHETVGGMPTVAGAIHLGEIAKACGYENVISADNFEELDKGLQMVKEGCGLSFVEVKCAVGARKNLGRPTVAPLENRQDFMGYLDTL